MKKDLIFALVAFLAIGAVCFGLAAAKPQEPLQPSPALVETRSTEAEGRVVMRVNGEPITEHEFTAFIAEAPEQMQFFYASPQGRRLLAEELVKLKALEQEGRRLGVADDPHVAGRIAVSETNMIAGSALRRIIGTPSEDRLRAEYEKEKGQLESTELSHILLAYEGGALPPKSGGASPPEAAARQKAQRLAARILGGADFAAVAREESDDAQSGANGGSLGLVQPGALPPDIQSAVAQLQPGQISEPVKSEFGIHIFKVGERRSQPYEAVREALAARIQRDEAQAAMERLKTAAQVELDPKFFGPENKPRT